MESRVAIVGRMNVGKSTLFNRLSDQVKSITYDYPGVTRDILKEQVVWKDRSFELVDTGGIAFRETNDPLLSQVRKKAIDTLEKSDLILFVVDGAAGLTQEDREIAQIVRRYNKKMLIVVNKSDTKLAQEQVYEFYELPHDVLVPISAEHGTNIAELLDEVINLLPVKGGAEIKKATYNVVFIGRPNVGKSSLMNALLDQERALVSDIAGTTREALSETITFYQEHLQITDTPGIRRKGNVEEDLEQLMVKSSFQALKNTNIVVLVLDPSQEALVDQELKLAFYAFQEQHKALIIVINKSDLLDEMQEQAIENSFSAYPHLIDKVPVLRISCKTGKNVGKLLPLIKETWDRFSQRFEDHALKHILLDALRKTPLVRNRQLLLVRNVKQINTAPITIAMKVNNPDWFENSQRSFFENVLRREFNLNGVPIKWVIGKK